MAKKIYLDAGHGGKDPGAVNGKRTEAADVLRMALRVGELLKAQGIDVKQSRTGDTAKDLNVRTAESNSWGSDYYLSIHRNSFDGTATGNEIWVINTATPATAEKAKKILDGVCQANGLKNRGVKYGAPSYKNFAVNRDTKCASALLELSFISNNSDNTAFDKYFEATAVAIAKALCEIVGVPYKTNSKGDINGDGKVNSSDAREALRAAAKLTNLTAEQTARADMDGDGKVTSKDAREILQKAAGLK